MYILERTWFNLDILYDVLTEMGIPTISGDYKGPTVMEIVEDGDGINTIYTSLHDTLTLHNVQKFPTHILIHLHFYYLVGMGGLGEDNGSNAQYTTTQEAIGTSYLCIWRIISEIVLQMCYFSILLPFLYHNIYDKCALFILTLSSHEKCYLVT